MRKRQGNRQRLDPEKAKERFKKTGRGRVRRNHYIFRVREREEEDSGESMRVRETDRGRVRRMHDKKSGKQIEEGSGLRIKHEKARETDQGRARIKE